MDLGRYYQLAAIEDSDYGAAENYYFLALEEAKNSDAPVIQSTCLYYLGLLYYDINNKTQAKLRFEEGLGIALSYDATREADRHQSMLTLILVELGQSENSSNKFEQIIANAELNNDRVRQADYTLAMATAEYKIGNKRGAKVLFNQAAEMYLELGRNQEVEGIKKQLETIG
jgi:tetratricopeptide (TPR) repeat protein